MRSMLEILEDSRSHLNFKVWWIHGATIASESQKQIVDFNRIKPNIFIVLSSIGTRNVYTSLVGNNIEQKILKQNWSTGSKNAVVSSLTNLKLVV
uniref:Uncharacterized protein n=1 Tax=Physcomitrium patens TaxID=3218 RepID=A0A2K1L240_PHYPA|nr:hypothetical protein PHYPA_002885 [Physcomitrium patens]